MMALGIACVVPNPELACGDEASADAGSEGESSEGSDTQLSASTNPDVDSSEGSSLDSDMDSDMESSDTTDTTDTSDSSTPDLAGEPLCPLLSEVGDGCQTCVDLYCCSAIELCQIDEDCTCLLDCLLSGSVTTICEVTCGLGSSLPSLAMTLDCLDQHCSEDCPNTP